MEHHTFTQATLSTRPLVKPETLEVAEEVQTHGRITRREAAELCQIGKYQATRLLARLVASDQLRRLGRGRGTYYEPV